MYIVALAQAVDCMQMTRKSIPLKCFYPRGGQINLVYMTLLDYLYIFLEGQMDLG